MRVSCEIQVAGPPYIRILGSQTLIKLETQKKNSTENQYFSTIT